MHDLAHQSDYYRHISPNVYITESVNILGYHYTVEPLLMATSDERPHSLEWALTLVQGLFQGGGGGGAFAPVCCCLKFYTVV